MIHKTKKPRCLHRFFLLNISLGVLVVATALYFIVTGEYANLMERREVEGMLNRVALAALLYSIFTWFADVYYSPRCKTE